MLVDTPQFRALQPASRLVLLVLREVLPSRGWGPIPGRVGALAELTGMPPERVEHAFDELVSSGLVLLDGNTIYLHPIAARRPPSPKPAWITASKPPAPPKPKGPPRRRVYTDYSPEFEAAWAIYPRRLGGNPKRAAYKAWCARLAEGVTPAELHAAVERYAAYVEAMVADRGEEARRYVMQAQTFFGPHERWKDEYEYEPSGPDPYALYGE